MNTEDVQLVRPEKKYLASYISALQTGWTPDNVRGPESAAEFLAAIERDADAYLESLFDLEAEGPPIMLPDGSSTTRLPGYHKWVWDGEFCGTVGFRWMPGRNELPPLCLGHIGCAIVPWKRGRGYGTRALHLMLPEARAIGLDYLDVVTDADNTPGRKSIEKNGARLLDEFQKPAIYGGMAAVRYRIFL